MEYTYLGKSGLKISKVVLGCMSYGSSKWQPWVLDEDEALPLLKQAYDLGINSWDTANVYSNGDSERVIRKAIEKYSIPRKNLVIMTKLHGAVGPEPGTQNLGKDVSNDLYYINQNGLSRASIFNAFYDSLERLGMDHVDLLQIHRADKTVPKEETMKALHDLVESGKVRYIGASSMWAWEFAEYQHVADKNGWTKFSSMQNQYSLMYREEEREMIPYCHHTGVGLIPWFPLNAGKLARPFTQLTSTTRGEQVAKFKQMFGDTTEEDQEIIKRVEKTANDKKWSMAQVAMVWARQKGTSPIVGISKADRMKEAAECVSWKLTHEEMKYLEEPYKPVPVRGHM